MIWPFNLIFKDRHIMNEIKKKQNEEALAKRREYHRTIAERQTRTDVSDSYPKRTWEPQPYRNEVDDFAAGVYTGMNLSSPVDYIPSTTEPTYTPPCESYSPPCSDYSSSNDCSSSMDSSFDSGSSCSSSSDF